MSYITPKVYYQQAEVIAAEYARLRDAMSGTLNTNTLGISKVIVQETDDDSDTIGGVLTHDIDRDPVGSIALDLGSSFAALGIKFKPETAQSLAAGYYSTALKGLNGHVIKRTPIPSGVTTMRTIGQYYEAYKNDPAAVPQNDDMSLFTHESGGTGVDTSTEASYYFSDDFVELSNELGLTYLNSGSDGEIYTQDYYA